MNHIVCVCNFTPVPREHYRVGVPYEGYYRELLNSDAAAYGGSNMGNAGRPSQQRGPLPRDAPFTRSHTPSSVSAVPQTDLIRQDAEKARQRRSRIVQTLNVPLRVRLGIFTRCGLADSLFEHPAQKPCCATQLSASQAQTIEVQALPQSFSAV